MQNMTYIATTLLCGLIMLFPGSLGFKTGAPPKACVTQIPGHGVAAQSSTSPYRISASDATYRAHQGVKVSISGKFQGFMVQARTANGTTVGTFSDTKTGTKTTKCSAADDTWTHSSDDLKRDIDVTWYPPNNNVGPVRFRGTVLQKYDTFWVGLESSELMYTSDPDLHTMSVPTSDVCHFRASAYLVGIALGIYMLK